MFHDQSFNRNLISFLHDDYSKGEVCFHIFKRQHLRNTISEDDKLGYQKQLMGVTNPVLNLFFARQTININLISLFESIPKTTRIKSLVFFGCILSETETVDLLKYFRKSKILEDCRLLSFTGSEEYNISILNELEELLNELNNLVYLDLFLDGGRHHTLLIDNRFILDNLVYLNLGDQEFDDCSFEWHFLGDEYFRSLKYLFIGSVNLVYLLHAFDKGLKSLQYLGIDSCCMCHSYLHKCELGCLIDDEFGEGLGRVTRNIIESIDKTREQHELDYPYNFGVSDVGEEFCIEYWKAICSKGVYLRYIASDFFCDCGNVAHKICKVNRKRNRRLQDLCWEVIQHSKLNQEHIPDIIKLDLFQKEGTLPDFLL